MAASPTSHTAATRAPRRAPSSSMFRVNRMRLNSITVNSIRSVTMPTIANSTVVVPRCRWTFMSASRDRPHGDRDRHGEAEVDRIAEQSGQDRAEQRLVRIGRHDPDIAAADVGDCDLARLEARKAGVAGPADVPVDGEILGLGDYGAAQFHDPGRAIDRVRRDEARGIPHGIRQRRVVDERPADLGAAKEQEQDEWRGRDELYDRESPLPSRRALDAILRAAAHQESGLSGSLCSTIL